MISIVWLCFERYKIFQITPGGFSKIRVHGIFTRFSGKFRTVSIIDIICFDWV